MKKVSIENAIDLNNTSDSFFTMIFKVLTIFVLTCSDLTFMSVSKRSAGMGKASNHENFQSVNEKKIHFTGNSAQFLKFDVKLPNVSDFAMCLWYKPQVILDNNILFSYGSKDRQLILWKIKKKGKTLSIILKILNTKIMEEKLETLYVGQWHHLCQYWQGSTGLWSLFLNTYIVSFGYADGANTTNWSLNGVNMSATINHPNTKKTLHGEIYGFHLMSTNFDSGLQKPDEFKLLPTPLLPTPLPVEVPRNRRQVETFDPVTPESRTPFFRLRNFFKFIRRMISLVTVPVFRFARRLIQPWTRRFVPLRPTTGQTPKSSTPAPPTSTVRTLGSNSTTQNGTTPQNTTASSNSNSTVSRPAVVNGTSYKNNLTEVKQKTVSGFTEEHFDSFDESIVIYEPEYEPSENRPSRNVMNLAKSSSSVLDSIEVLSSSEEKPAIDKCTFIAEKMDSKVDKLNSSENFVTPSIEKSVDAITQLGPHLQFVQFLYSCCALDGNNVLISWEETKVMLNNVVIDTVEGCGNF